ncbi:MAG: hypothetical protein IT210_11275 [Armatimonadetes bacterium]|nr:hypothetical protein [Armatimonadota bacterium]
MLKYRTVAWAVAMVFALMAVMVFTETVLAGRTGGDEKECGSIHRTLPLWANPAPRESH